MPLALYGVNVNDCAWQSCAAASDAMTAAMKERMKCRFVLICLILFRSQAAPARRTRDDENKGRRFIRVALFRCRRASRSSDDRLPLAGGAPLAAAGRDDRRAGSSADDGASAHHVA